jgi:hypothetical protein
MKTSSRRIATSGDYEINVVIIYYEGFMAYLILGIAT